MIDVRGLVKRFEVRESARWRSKKRVVEAVRDVSFTARDGAITALLGPNGAGKTTTLRILSTLAKPDGGSATIGGRDVTREAQAVRADIGLLSDARGLYPRMTARENVRYFGRLRGLDDATIDTRTRSLAAMLEFEPLLDRRTEGFSTGERLKVALARTLVHDPRHLILDEPTNGLDVLSTRALRRMLRALRERGLCVLFSSHIMQEVDLLCDEVAIIAHGRTIAHGTVDEIVARSGASSLEDAFVTLAFAPDAQRTHEATP